MPRSTFSTLAIATLIGAPPSLVLACFLFWPGPDGLDQYGYPFGRDFINLWTGGHLALTGRVGEIFDLDRYAAAVHGFFPPMQRFMNFSYPPHTLLLLLPVGLLPPPLALGLWVAIGLCAYVVAALGWPIRSDRRAVIVLLLLSPVALLNAAIGQAGLLLALAFVAGFRLLPHRPAAAGVLFGLLTVKPHLGVLIPFALLSRRAWRAIMVAVVTALALIAVSLLLYGVAPWRAFFANTVAYQTRVVLEMAGFYTTMMYSPYALFWQFGLGTGVSLALHAVIAAPVGLIALVVFRRADDTALAAAVLALATVIVPPYSLCYDLAIPTAAIVSWLVRRDAPLDWPTRIVLAAFWAVAFIMMPLTLLGLPVSPLIVLATFVCLARIAVQTAGASNDALTARMSA